MDLKTSKLRIFVQCKLTKQEEVFKTNEGLTLKIFKELPQILKKKSTRKSQEPPKKVISSHSQFTKGKS